MPTELTLRIEQDNLERVKYTKCLGIYIDENMNCGPHIEHCIKKICSGLYAMNAAKRTRGTDHLRILYFCLIHPYISYGNVLWCKSYKQTWCIGQSQAKLYFFVFSVAAILKNTTKIVIKTCQKLLLAK